MKIENILCGIRVAGLLAVLTQPAMAGVSGHFLPADAQTRRIQLTVTQPVPRAFIVVQHLPAGARLVEVTPPPSGNRSKKTIRWLFKHPKPGSLLIQIRLDRAWPRHRASIGRILYKKPRSAVMIQKEIMPLKKPGNHRRRPGFRR